MDGDAVLFSLSLIDCLFLLFLTVYFWVLIDIIGQSSVNLGLIFINFHWLLALLNFPMTAWLINKFVNKPSGNIGAYDPAEIHNRLALKGHMREVMVKLGFHLIFFFIYLYSMIAALLS